MVVWLHGATSGRVKLLFMACAVAWDGGSLRLSCMAAAVQWCVLDVLVSVQLCSNRLCTSAGNVEYTVQHARITCSQHKAVCGAMPPGSVRLAIGNQSWMADAAE